MPIKKPLNTSNAGPGRQERTQRTPTGLLAIACLTLFAGAGWWWLRSPAAFSVSVNSDRNVLLVTIDTLRADALGSYGGRASTPNLDRLAAGGARFTFAHAHTVVTLPSHASILSGRYPYEHGIRDNTGYRFDPKQPTLATALKALGFATGAFIGGFPLDRRFGLSVGFDRYDDRLGGAAADGERERRADAVVGSALDWIAEQKGKWFAWVHLYDPHATYQPPPEWAAKFPGDLYLGEVSWTDAALGILLERAADQARPTMIVVTADHGEGLGDHGETTHSVFAYESTLRVPLIVGETHAGTPAGRVIDTPVRHVDLAPTILEAVGAAGTPSSGSSLIGVIGGRNGADRPSYFEAMTPAVTRGWAPLRGVLVGREKYIDLPMVELYDLAADPGESRNLVAARPDRAQVLLNALKLFNIAPPGRARAESADTLERLRSLGYIGGGTAAVREQYTEADDPKRLIELEQMMERAAAADREGRASQAIDLYRTVIARRKDTEDAYRKLALLHWRAGRPGEAVATLEEALKNGVTQSEVRIKLAQYLAESGQPVRAIALLEHDAAGDPDALVALGNAFAMAGRGAEAMRTFQQLAALDPANGLAHENIGALQLQDRNFAAAEASLRHAIELDPQLAGAHTALGVALANTGRRAEAIESWKQAVQIDPREFNALFNLTVNLQQSGHQDEARLYGRRFIATAPPALQADVAAIRRMLGENR
jgi:arylsulfatase A-like enzyme/tetratricopeptide (TPR) repeat protein